jgi:hypothetical protein
MKRTDKKYLKFSCLNLRVHTKFLHTYTILKYRKSSVQIKWACTQKCLLGFGSPQDGPRIDIAQFAFDPPITQKDAEQKLELLQC